MSHMHTPTHQEIYQQPDIKIGNAYRKRDSTVDDPVEKTPSFVHLLENTVATLLHQLLPLVCLRIRWWYLALWQRSLVYRIHKDLP